MGGILAYYLLKKTGKTVITATLASGVTVNINLTVQNKAVKTVKLSANKSTVNLSIGNTFAIKATKTPFTSKDSIKYFSSNKKIATVSTKGKITAKKSGTAYITATVLGKKFTCKVTVKKASNGGFSDAPSTPAQTPSGMTMGQKNALEKAKSYLMVSSFSYDGLIHQLEFNGFSTAEATFAVDNCGANWFEQALKKAKSYLNVSAFSYTGLIHQLEFNKFTTPQATYAANNCGADWYKQAAKKAESYLRVSSFSRDGLIRQLEFNGFTKEQAEYGVTKVGY